MRQSIGEMTISEQHTFRMSRQQAELVFKVIASHRAALKNWTMSSVAHGDFDKAQEYAREDREYNELYKAFNVVVDAEIREVTGLPRKTEHQVHAAFHPTPKPQG